MTVSIAVCVLIAGAVATILLVKQDEVRAWQAVVIALTGFLLALTPVGSFLRDGADRIGSSSSTSQSSKG